MIFSNSANINLAFGQGYIRYMPCVGLKLGATWWCSALQLCGSVLSMGNFLCSVYICADSSKLPLGMN